jgi:hypothetical protein
MLNKCWCFSLSHAVCGGTLSTTRTADTRSFSIRYCTRFLPMKPQPARCKTQIEYNTQMKQIPAIHGRKHMIPVKTPSSLQRTKLLLCKMNETIHRTHKTFNFHINVSHLLPNNNFETNGILIQGSTETR